MPDSKGKATKDEQLVRAGGILAGGKTLDELHKWRSTLRYQGYKPAGRVYQSEVTGDWYQWMKPVGQLADPKSEESDE